MKATRHGSIRTACRRGLLIAVLCLVTVGIARAADGPGTLVDMLFVLDNSGSMLKNDPNYITRRVVTDFIDAVDDDFRIGMVIFDAEARLVEPLMDVAASNAAQRYLSALEAITYKGQLTNTPAAVERALYELKTNGREGAQKAILLLTDGIIDTGSAQTDAEGEQWLKEGLTLESRELGVRIFGVAFTENADYRLMQTLAVQTDGEYFRAFSPGDIQRIFESVLKLVSEYSEKSTAAVEPEPVTTAAPDPTTVAAENLAEPVAAETVPESPPAESRRQPFRWSLFMIAAALLALLLVAILLLLRGKKPASPKPGMTTEPAIGDGEDPSTDMPHAELIDAENVISDEAITLSLTKNITKIGRDRLNDIVIARDSISSLHATIQYRNGYFYLEDQRSTNGTRLNDAVIRENRPIRLKSGDKIHFAIYEFRFLMEDMAPYGETVMLDKQNPKDTDGSEG